MTRQLVRRQTLTGFRFAGCARNSSQIKMLDHRATWCAHLVLRAIPAENRASRVFGVDIGPNGLYLKSIPRHDSNVDSTFVVPVDQHDVPIESSKEFNVEPDQRRLRSKKGLLSDPSTTADRDTPTDTSPCTPKGMTASGGSTDSRIIPEKGGARKEQLAQLSWILGEWANQDSDSVVHTNCDWSEDGNYLLRRFTVQTYDGREMNGVQRTGWDPARKKLHSWTFDSEGRFFNGLWTKQGSQWLLTIGGTTAEGKTVTGTAVYTIVDSEMITWRFRNLIVGDEVRNDSEVRDRHWRDSAAPACW